MTIEEIQARKEYQTFDCKSIQIDPKALAIPMFDDRLVFETPGDLPGLVSFDYQVREILVNAIGNHLLSEARKGLYKDSPIIVFIDEAHQFLNKSIADEYFSAKPLYAFEQISKEARKYGLFLCIATQMPRDIPLGTLSQMGTFVVHRLINEQDKKAVENAASAANRNSLSFLPILGEGEALIVGVDFPMPLTIKIDVPQKSSRFPNT